jgi:hypothetical protein
MGSETRYPIQGSGATVGTVLVAGTNHHLLKVGNHHLTDTRNAGDSHSLASADSVGSATWNGISTPNGSDSGAAPVLRIAGEGLTLTGTLCLEAGNGVDHWVGVGGTDEIIAQNQAASRAASSREWNLWNLWVIPMERVGLPMLPLWGSVKVWAMAGWVTLRCLPPGVMVAPALQSWRWASRILTGDAIGSVSVELMKS